jgi:hypothetical protein
VTNVSDSIYHGLRDALTYAEGNADERLYRIHYPKETEAGPPRADPGRNRARPGNPDYVTTRNAGRDGMAMRR